MRIMIVSEFRCHIYNNEYYLSSKAYSIYKRYADGFGKVLLCSRFVYADKLPEGLIKVDFIEDTIHINSLLSALFGKYNRQIEAKIKSCDLVIGRLPSVTAFKVSDIAKRHNVPYFAELMCDGWDPYWNHGISGKFLAPFMHLKMKQVTRNADYAIYVTEKYLQHRYPCRKPNIYASNVLIKPVDSSILEKRLKKIDDVGCQPKEISAMTTANVDLLSKGQRYVVRAMGELKKRGIVVRYYLAGAGSHEHLLSEATKAGVTEQLVFLGELTLDQVYEQLDKTDIYIQPSLQEGLPRSVIEAMSRGCACVGAKTAGIPELLEEQFVVGRKSVSDIVDVIEAYNKLSIDERKRIATRNFNESKKYTVDVLNERRNNFFTKILKDLNGE